MSRSLCVLAVFPLACIVLAAPAPRPFVSGWGEPVDPDKDCKIRRDKDVLTIEMPGTVHDYDPFLKRVNSPRLVRDFEGNFEIQFRVRIDCRPSGESSVEGQPSYVSAGFLVIPLDKFEVPFMRHEYRVSGQGVESDGCAVEMFRHDNGLLCYIVMDKRRRDWPF